MTTATITFHFDKPEYEGAAADLEKITDAIYTVLGQHFRDYQEAHEAKKTYDDILKNFVWDFPTESQEQKGARATALDAVISQDVKARHWQAFLDDAGFVGADLFYGCGMGNPAEAFQFSIRFNPSIDGGAGPMNEHPSRPVPLLDDDESYASTYYGEKGAGEDARVEAFKKAAQRFRRAKRADDVAWLNHNPCQGGNYEALQQTEKEVAAAHEALASICKEVTRAEASGLGLLNEWKEGTGETSHKLEFEEGYKQPIISCPWM